LGFQQSAAEPQLQSWEQRALDDGTRVGTVVRLDGFEGCINDYSLDDVGARLKSI